MGPLEIFSRRSFSVLASQAFKSSVVFNVPLDNRTFIIFGSRSFTAAIEALLNCFCKASVFVLQMGRGVSFKLRSSAKSSPTESCGRLAIPSS